MLLLLNTSKNAESNQKATTLCSTYSLSYHLMQTHTVLIHSLYSFKPDESLGAATTMKKSVIRGIKSSIVEQYPGLEDVIEDILPKKARLSIVKV